jgi:hypothetical protein
MRISTLPFFRFRRLGGYPSPFLLLLAVFLSFGGAETFAQCTSCTPALTVNTNVPADQVRSLTANNNQVICLRGTGSYRGNITLAGNNVTLCVDQGVTLDASATINFTGSRITIRNYGTWEEPFNMARTGNNGIEGNGIIRVENRGTMTITINPGNQINRFIIQGNATFSNYGNLTINGSVEVAQGNNRFENLDDGAVTINGNVTVAGNGANGGFFHSGANVTVSGDFNNADANTNTEISGPLTVNSLSINGGRFDVVKSTVTVNTSFTVQGGGDTRVSGGTPETNCGSINVTGNSVINSGTFGFAGFLGVCNPQNGQGGFTQQNGGNVTTGGSLGCSCNQILPITLIYFTAKQQESQVLLQWATASEKDNEYFSLEKSRDGQQFHEIGRVAGAGTSTGRLTYQFTDDFPFGGTGYYRLKQVDFDGTFTYSRIVAVNSEITAALRIYPNPLAGNELWVEATDAQADDMRITIHNTVGKLLVDRVYAYEPAVQVDLSALRREPGLYIISVRRKNRIERQKLVIH